MYFEDQYDHEHILYVCILRVHVTGICKQVGRPMSIYKDLTKHIRRNSDN